MGRHYLQWSAHSCTLDAEIGLALSLSKTSSPGENLEGHLSTRKKF